MTTTTDPTTHTIDTPGAVIHYDVRRPESSTESIVEPALLLIGSPMGAFGFTSLAGYFTDRTVVTYDPRSAERSVRTDGATETTVEEHAEDLGRLIDAVGGGPVDIFASSGGAVNALAFVAIHPDRVRTLIAHEPPALTVLPDREEALAANRDIRETYLREGHGPAMAKFIVLVGHKGPVPADWTSRPAPDPSMFGMSAEDDGSRNDPLVGQNIVTCTSYEYDFDALRAASTHIVIAVGEESEGESARRAGEGVAERLGQRAVIFPSNHGGFLGDEYGMPGQPEAFAAKLREVLAG